MSEQTAAAATPPRNWDPIVKLTHWGIVLAVIVNSLFTEEGSGWHIWVGYGLLGLLALRLLWGLIGPAEARFSAFPPSPSKAIAHVEEIRAGKVSQHKSHNPLGSLMVYAIWAVLGIIIASGIFMSGPPPADPNAPREHEEKAEMLMDDAGSVAPVANYEGDERAYEAYEERYEAYEHDDDDEHEEGEEEGEEVMEEIHEIAVNLLYLLIALHIAGVVFETRRSGREILNAMLPFGSRKGE